MSSSGSKLLRSVALGTAGGLLAGAVYLAVKALLFAAADCPAGLEPNDCLLEAELARDLSRIHFAAASGLLVIGVAMAVNLRSKPKGAP